MQVMSENLVRCEHVQFKCDSHSSVPFGRSGHRIACIAGDIYLIGGFVELASGLRVRGEIWAFNLLSSRWRKLKLPGFPFRLALSTSVNVVGKRLIIHGGTGKPFGQNIDNSLIEVDVAQETWRLYPSQPKDGKESNVPVPTYGHTLTYVNIPNRAGVSRLLLYKVGGAMGVQYTSNISVFDFDAGTWETLYTSNDDAGSSIEPRYRHDTAFWKDEVYIFSGSNENGCISFSKVPVFDVNKRTCREITFSGIEPPPLRCQCSVQFNEVVYMAGGHIELEGRHNDTVYAFNLSTLSCTAVGRHPLPAFFHDIAAVPWSGQFFSFGGIRGQHRVNDMHVFTLTNQPLSLQELCWRQLSRQLRNCFYQRPLQMQQPLAEGFLAFLCTPAGSKTGDEANRCEVGHNDASDAVDGGSVLQRVYKFAKMVFGQMLEYDDPFITKPTAPLLKSLPSGLTEFLNVIIALHSEILKKNERRRIDPIESISIFLAALLYFLQVPSKYIIRLPYGYRSFLSVYQYVNSTYVHRNSTPGR